MELMCVNVCNFFCLQQIGKQLTKREILSLIKREVQIVREQSKAKSSNRLRRAQTLSARAKKIAHTSARKDFGRAQTVGSVATEQQHDTQHDNNHDTIDTNKTMTMRTTPPPTKKTPS